MKIHFPCKDRKIIDRAVVILAHFEDADFPISSHYDALLTQLYGDWHTPSPPAERKCKEHVAILDLERPHTEYLEIQQTMRIEDHTRSIR